MKKFLALSLLLLGTAAHADTLDRINECEAKGGGSCLYDLLRELAQNNKGSDTPDFFKVLVKIKSYARYNCEGEASGLKAGVVNLSLSLDDQAKVLCNGTFAGERTSVNINGTCTDLLASSEDYANILCWIALKKEIVK